jgi:hypothetical protein
MSAWRQDSRLEPVPDVLRGALELVLGDLQGARPIELLVGFEPGAEPNPDGEWESLLWFTEPDGWEAGYAPYEQSGPALVVDLAEYLQEHFFPESRQAWGEARPECPGHPHPTVPEVRAGEAWWTCPLTSDRVARLGTLRDRR